MSEMKTLKQTTGYDEVEDALVNNKPLRDDIIDEFYDEKMIELLSRVDEELTSVLGELWNQLKQQNQQFVCVHTMLVLWCAMEDNMYQKMDWEQKNRIKWACLLHDLKKLSIPAIEGKDHIHGFKSASAVLDVFKSLKIIEAPEGS